MLGRPEIKRHVDHQLGAARGAMAPRVRAAFDRLLDERQFRTPDVGPYFHPLGHPLFELPVWVVERLTAEGRQTPLSCVSAALGVSSLGYLHARSQDDWLDGGRREDPTLVALAEALVAACSPLLASLVGSSPRFWATYREIMTGYAESLLHADELRKRSGTVTRSTFERLLAQSRPLVIPSAALLDRADRWDLLPGVEEFVFTATAASQIHNDLLDLFRDLESRQPTWTLETLREAGLDKLWLDVLDGSGDNPTGAFQGRVREALDFHDRSALAARDVGLAAAEPWLAERQAALEGLVDSLRGALANAFVRRLAGPGHHAPGD